MPGPRRAGVLYNAAMNLPVRAVVTALLAGLAAASAAEQTAPGEPYLVIDGRVDRATYTGWQLFSENCAQCHGAGAVGSGVAPDLTTRVSHLTLDQFRIRVLHRYFLTVPLDEAVAEGSPTLGRILLEAVQAQAEREVPRTDMPRWQHNPDVRSHIGDLYAYLAARADGVIGPGVPELLPE